MAQDFQADVLEKQIRECFGRVVYTHKTHEKCADIIHVWNSRVKFAQIFLSAIITTGLVTIIFKDSLYTEIALAVMGALLVALNTYLKGNDLGELAQKHAEAAANIWDIRESYFSLIADIRGNQIEISKALETRDKLQARLASVYKGVPRTFSSAYRAASAGLQNNEELTFSDQEIDAFLPTGLRSTD